MSRSALLRSLAAVSVLVLGILAARRLPWEYIPRSTFPELTVELHLAQATDPTEIARAWLAPVEAEIHGLGEVLGIAGEVDPDAALLRVRFAPGVDPDRKASRLAAALGRLRSHLPDGGELRVWPGSIAGGDLAAVLWLEGAADEKRAQAAAELFRAVRGVRDVDLQGGTREETRVEVFYEHSRAVPAIRRELARALAVERLGDVAGVGGVAGASRRPLWVQSGVQSRAGNGIGSGRLELSTLTIPDGQSAFPLSSLARIDVRQVPVERQVHREGRPGRALYVWRELEASPLAVVRGLADRRSALPPGVTVRFLKDEAEPLRQLLLRLGLGLLFAMLATTLAGGRVFGLSGALHLLPAVPVALAAAFLAYRLTGLSLNVITLPALVLAVGAAVVWACLRLSGGVFGVSGVGGVGGSGRWGGLPAALVLLAAAVALPAGVALAVTPANPLLVAPARAFALAVLAAVPALALLPLPGGRLARTGARMAWPLRVLRAALRDPGAAVLAGASAAYLFLALWSSALVLRPTALSAAQGDLALAFDLPEGTTLEETDEQVGLVEKALAGVEGIRGSWSSFSAGKARIEVELAPTDRQPARLQLLVARLRLSVPNAAAMSIEAGEMGESGRPSTFRENLEDEARADDTSYRVLLRAVDGEALRIAYSQVLDRLRAEKIRLERIHADWGAPTLRLELAPAAVVPVARVAAVAAALRDLSLPPPSLRLPGPGDPRVLVLPPGASSDPEHVPQRAALLDRGLATTDGILVATDLFRVSERLHPRRLTYQSGRFVLPVTIDLTEPSTTGRRSRREAIDRGLARVALPGGCSLERPALSFFALHREDLRAAALAGCLALLWLAIAAFRLDSLRAGLASLAPLGLGLAAATPVIWAAAGTMDELTLLGLAASLAGALPVATILVWATNGPAAGSSAGSARAYRRVRQRVPGALVGALGFATLLLVPALGASPYQEVWVTPLYAAAAGGIAALLAAVFFLPPLFQAIRPRREERSVELERRSPPAWSAPGPPSLRVRNLTRIYRGGFRALSGASFELGPGIVGLLGPNGAGKTTLLRTLVGLLEPARGAVLYRGEPVARDNLADYRRRLGFLPQEFNAYPGFTGERFLDYWAAARGLPAGEERRREIERLLAAVGLEEHARRKVRDYSGGMRRRIGIAAALLGAPELLIVDEPTTGLDLESRNRFRQILLAAAGERILLLSTHIASDVEAIATRLLVLRRGRLCFDGEADQLIAAARGRVFEAVLEDSALRPFSQRFQITSRVRRLDGIWVRAVARAGSEPEGRLVEPSLEEAYLSTLDLPPSHRPSEPEPAVLRPR